MFRLGRGTVVCILAWLFSCGEWTPPALAATMILDVKLSGGATDRVLLLQPDQQPAAALVMLPGGNGVVGIDGAGNIATTGNFLVRTRNAWVKQGFAVAIPDTPSNHADTLFGVRLTAEYADTLRQVIDTVRAKTDAPVWLVGTSQGTNAAVNTASRIARGEIAGLVLTSSVTEAGRTAELRETVFGADLAAIDVATLIAYNTDDKCALTPVGDVTRLKAALIKAPRVEILSFSGGLPPKSKPCEAMSAHGFYGIEPAVVARISQWIERTQ
jgi:hypothetical protein